MGVATVCSIVGVKGADVEFDNLLGFNVVELVRPLLCDVVF